MKRDLNNLPRLFDKRFNPENIRHDSSQPVQKSGVNNALKAKIDKQVL